MNLEYAVDRLYQTGWTPSGDENLDRLPDGYRTPSWEPSERTFDLLVEHRLRYDSTLMDDDRPYVLETAHGTLVELPPHWSLDDWNQYMYLPDPRSGPGTVHPPSRALDLSKFQ